MDYDLVMAALRVTRRNARFHFRRYRSRDEWVNDAVSVAWELAVRAGPDATPGSISRYAIKRVRVSRQFRESIRSATHPKHRLRQEEWTSQTYEDDRASDGEPVFLRSSHESYFHCNDNPAEIVQAVLDVEAWHASLSPRLMRVASLFATGHGNAEIAALVGKSFARVSQLRAELRESWADFIADERE